MKFYFFLAITLEYTAAIWQILQYCSDNKSVCPKHQIRFCLFQYFMCANSEGSGETARMRRLAWAFAGRLCDKYHNLISWLNCGLF